MKKKETEQRKKEDFVKQSDHRLTNQIEDMLHFLELSAAAAAAVAAAAAAAAATTTKTREKRRSRNKANCQHNYYPVKNRFLLNLFCVLKSSL